MSAIFVSYRRQDSPYAAHAVRDELASTFCPDDVFLDVGGQLKPGDSFPEHLRRQLGDCEVLLSVIGPRWLTTRLHDPRDWVRIEIESAIRRKIPVIPVLVEGADLPPPLELPETISSIVTNLKHSIDVGQGFHANRSDLARAVETVIYEQRRNKLREFSTPKERDALSAATEMKLRWIPPGIFKMGSAGNEGHASERPRHSVLVERPFWIGVYPVTQREYYIIRSMNPSFYREVVLTDRDPPAQQDEQSPVDSVSWQDAVEFCREFSIREGLTPYYEVQGNSVLIPNVTGDGYRLPTEHEWEYACRAGASTKWFCHEPDLPQHAWFGKVPDDPDTYKPMWVDDGDFRANRWGLFHMHGNVREWCWDEYREDYSRRRLSINAESDGTTERTLRGGAFSDKAEDIRSASRFRDSPMANANIYGFRVARNA